MGGCCVRPANQVHAAPQPKPLLQQSSEKASPASPSDVHLQTSQQAQTAFRPFLTQPRDRQQAGMMLKSLSKSSLFERNSKLGFALEPLPSTVDGIDVQVVVRNLISCIDLRLELSLNTLEAMRVEEEKAMGTTANIQMAQAITALLQSSDNHCDTFDTFDGRPVGQNIKGKRSVLEQVSCGLQALTWLGITSGVLAIEKSTMDCALGTRATCSPTTKIPASMFHVESVNRIFSICFPSICDPSAGMEVVVQVHETFMKFRQLLGTLGVIDDVSDDVVNIFEGLPFIALNSTSKAYLLYVDTLVGM